MRQDIVERIGHRKDLFGCKLKFTQIVFETIDYCRQKLVRNCVQKPNQGGGVNDELFMQIRLFKVMNFGSLQSQLSSNT